MDSCSDSPNSFLRERWWVAVCVLWIAACQRASEPVPPVPAKSPSVNSTSAPIAQPASAQPPAVATRGVEDATTSQSAISRRPFIFSDGTADSGIDFTRFDDMRGENRIQEAIGGGAALVDFDLDGRLDVFFTQGCRLPLREKTNDYTHELFRNAGRFERVTGSAGLVAHGYYTGCAAADFDDDGFADLYVTAFGRSSLWRNNGDGTFDDVTELSHAAVSTWSTSAAWADFNGDGWLDLFVGTYAQAHDDPPLICKEPRSPTGTASCSPTLFAAWDDVLFVNDGQGGFVDVTSAAGINGRDGRGQGVVACDLTGDGWCDLYVTNDTTPSFLYVNTTGSHDQVPVAGTDVHLPLFAERGIEYGVALNGEGKATAAMGVGHGDYDRDGWLDLYVTNFYLEPNTLFRNHRGQAFLDVSSQSRTGPPTRSTLAFGAEFLDVDHDGWLDLFVTTGHIEDRTWTKLEPYRMRPHLFRNERNGRFTDVAAGAGDYFTSEWVGRGLALGDVDRDGDLDLVVAHQLDRSKLILNDTPAAGTSVIIKPVGTSRSPRNAIGTRVTAVGVTPILMRDLAGGGSFQSTSAQEIHLGLADRAEFEQLEIRWPDGQTERHPRVAAGYYIAIQGRGMVRIEFAPQGDRQDRIDP